MKHRMKSQTTDYTDKKFGLLTAIEFIGYKQYGKSNKKLAKYIFKCDCGKIVEKFIHNVKNGNTKTCGSKIHRRKSTFSKDLTGYKFGRLEVIKFLRIEPYIWKGIHRSKEIWQCNCICGNIKELTDNQIKTQHTKSCGCLLIEKRGSNPYKLPIGTAALNGYYSDYQDNAKRRKLKFNLTKDQFEKLIYNKCYYCNIEPYRIYPPNGSMKHRSCNGRIIVNGIDRINSDMGYIIENCITCCEICNKAKRDLNIEEFILWIKRIQKLNVEKIESNLWKLNC